MRYKNYFKQDFQLCQYAVHFESCMLLEKIRMIPGHRLS